MGDRASPYVVRITNDLYQPTETIVTSRTMQQQRTAGAAEAAAASAAAAAVGYGAKAVGALNKASANSATGLVGLRQVCVCFSFLICHF